MGDRTVRVTRLMDNPPDPASIEQRFGELFKVARVLLSEGVSEEEIIVPTLALANHVRLAWTLEKERSRLVDARGVSEAWEHEAEVFAARHVGLRALDVVDNILIVERLPAYVHVHTPTYVDEWDSGPEAGERVGVSWDTEVVVAVYPHSQPATPESVASLYEAALSSHGLTYGDAVMASLAVERREEYMLIIVEHRDRTLPIKPDEPGWNPMFPLPERVGEYYGLLMGKPSGRGFAGHLTTRKSGPAPDPGTLIPACVAVYLKTVLSSPKEIHKLLNQHVLRETPKEFPEEGITLSESTQLWRDVRKARDRLVSATYPLYSSEPEWIASHNRFEAKNLF